MGEAYDQTIRRSAIFRRNHILPALFVVLSGCSADSSPRVSSTVPFGDQENVHPAVEFEVTFSQRMDRDTVTVLTENSPECGSIQLFRDGVSDCVPMFNQPLVNGRTFSFRPVGGLALSTQYWVRVTRDARSLGGARLEDDYALRFTTQNRFDPTYGDSCFAMWDWMVEDSGRSRWHRYYVVASYDEWASGTLTFRSDPEGPVGVLVYDASETAAVAAYRSTNGVMSVSVMDGSLLLSGDITSAPIWALFYGTGGNAVGGTGGLTGFLNNYDDCFGDGNPSWCEVGSGDIAIMVGATNLNIGSSATPGTGSAYFVCSTDAFVATGTLLDFTHALLDPFPRAISR